MLFNTFEFAFFFLIVFTVYWVLLKGKRDLQNGFLFLASYFFYGWWDWRYLILIFFSTLVSYLSAIYTEKAENKVNQKLFLTLGIIINLGLLGFFKYYNFFVESFIAAFSSIGIHLQPGTLRIILPVGISFYTFMLIG